MKLSKSHEMSAISFFLAFFIICSQLYVNGNKEFLREVWNTYTHKTTGPSISDDLNISEFNKILPLSAIYVEIEDKSFVFGKDNFFRKDVEEKITNLLVAKATDNPKGVPHVNLTFSTRSAWPLLPGTFIATKLTVVRPSSMPVDGKYTADAVLYRSTRQGIYPDGSMTPQAAIEKSITRLQASIRMLNTSQSPKGKTPDVRMYEAPQKTIEGTKAP